MTIYKVIIMLVIFLDNVTEDKAVHRAKERAKLAFQKKIAPVEEIFKV
jgi:hypothetical protein